MFFNVDVEATKESFLELMTKIDDGLRVKGNQLIYATGQWELAPTTGRLHLQAAIKVANNVRPQWLGGLFQGHICSSFRAKTCKAPKGFDGAATYCNKEESRHAGPYDFGVKPVRGRANGKAAVIQLVNEGASFNDIIASDDPAVQGEVIWRTRQLQDYMAARARPTPCAATEEIVLYFGTSGSGKTWAAQRNHGAFYKWQGLFNGQLRWNGYQCQPSVLFEEFVGSKTQLGYQVWKDLCQRGDNYIGGSARFMCTTSQAADTLGFGSRSIVFTSNQLPTQWFEGQKMERGTLEAPHRFSKIVYMGGQFLSGNAWSKTFEGDSLREFWDFAKLYKQEKRTGHIFEEARKRWGPANSEPEPQEEEEEQVIFL